MNFRFILCGLLMFLPVHPRSFEKSDHVQSLKVEDKRTSLGRYIVIGLSTIAATLTGGYLFKKYLWDILISQPKNDEQGLKLIGANDGSMDNDELTNAADNQQSDVVASSNNSVTNTAAGNSDSLASQPASSGMFQMSPGEKGRQEQCCKCNNLFPRLEIFNYCHQCNTKICWKCDDDSIDNNALFLDKYRDVFFVKSYCFQCGVDILLSGDYGFRRRLMLNRYDNYEAYYELWDEELSSRKQNDLWAPIIPIDARNIQRYRSMKPW